MIHSYIMGFMYNPARTTTHYLYAGVLRQFPGTTADETATIVTVQGGGPYGPNVAIYNPNSALEYIKVAFVISRFDIALATNRPGFPATYPMGNSLLQYSSSYIYTPVTTFNTAVPIQRSIVAPFYPNPNYYQLPDARYAIYGVTAFDLPQNVNTSCSTILINATLDNINTYTLTTPNSNPTNVFFVADIFTVNVDNLCAPTDGTPFSVQKEVVGQKSFFTVPTMSLQQYIIEDSNAPITVPNIQPVNGISRSFNF